MLHFIIGLFLLANLSLFIYACILAGKKSEEKFFMRGVKSRMKI